MSEPVEVTLSITGRDYPLRLEPRRTLLDAIRDECGLTGTHMGCEHGVCGACTVLLDEQPIRACLMFAVQAEGAAIRTIEGLAAGDALNPVQRGFIAHHGVQCGFCTPGFLMLATGVLARDPANEALRPYRQPLLARDRLRYVGEPVAAVFATDAYLAEDAADLVTIEAEELSPVLDAAAPPSSFASGLSTEALVLRESYGEVDAAFASAYAIVALDLEIGRHSGVPLETRGALARYDSSRDVLELYGAAKVPHRNRDALVRMFARSAAGIVLKEGNTGGGFGIRGELYPEDFLVCLAAMRLERPVKWIEDRRENLMAANHSRQQRHHARVAVDADGRVLALEDEFYLDQGAYVRTHGARVLEMTISMLPGPYRIPAYRACGHFRLTNKTPAATYRAPGRYEGSFVRERLMDAVAERLGLEPIEIRRRK